MKKKVLIVGPGLEIGGVERSLIGLLNAIDYDKYDVDLFLEKHTGEFMPLINKNVNLIDENESLRLCSSPIKSLIKNGHLIISSIRILNKIIYDTLAKMTKTSTLAMDMTKKFVVSRMTNFKKQYDVALGFMVPHYIINDKVNAKLKIGWVHTDYTNVTEKPNSKRMLPMWEKLDKIACVSDNVKNSFDSIYPSLKDKTFVVENILDTEFIRKQANAFSVQSEMPKCDGLNILSIGRFCTAKAFDDVVVSSSILAKKGYKFTWYLIGYGADEELIKNKIEQYGMQNYVKILGKRSNPYPYIKACDIYAQPSRYEGKAVTVVEAQILNKPVIISRYATSSAQLDEGIDGYICEMGTQGVADGIEYLINNQDVVERIVNGTRQKQYSNYSEINKIL